MGLLAQKNQIIEKFGTTGNISIQLILVKAEVDQWIYSTCRSIPVINSSVYDPSLEHLLSIAHIIKFDFLLTPVDTLQKTLYRLSRYKLKYLAEKVESYEEFNHANKLGFSYFQGYFFCKTRKNSHQRNRFF